MNNSDNKHSFCNGNSKTVTTTACTNGSDFWYHYVLTMPQNKGNVTLHNFTTNEKGELVKTF